MIDMNKKYKTRDGDEVRIYAVDCGTVTEIHGAYKNEDGWYMRSWYEDGKYFGGNNNESGMDLIEVKPRIQRSYWMNIYKINHPPQLWPSEELARTADINGGSQAIGRIEVMVDIEEGEGL